MNYILDTHTLIWFLEGDENLSKNSLNHIQDLQNSCFVSSASLWEMAIKISLQKLKLNTSFQHLPELIWDNGLEILPIEFEHFLKISSLPFYHKDPFDRIIIAQSLLENFRIIGKDENFEQYGIKLIW